MLIICIVLGSIMHSFHSLFSQETILSLHIIQELFLALDASCVIPSVPYSVPHPLSVKYIIWSTGSNSLIADLTACKGLFHLVVTFYSRELSIAQDGPEPQNSMSQSIWVAPTHSKLLHGPHASLSFLGGNTEHLSTLSIIYGLWFSFNSHMNITNVSISWVISALSSSATITYTLSIFSILGRLHRPPTSHHLYVARSSFSL